MFLRPYARTKDGNAHHYLARVESRRPYRGARQHIVAYLGEFNRDQEPTQERGPPASEK
jgi:hypothetical protein